MAVFREEIDVEGAHERDEILTWAPGGDEVGMSNNAKLVIVRLDRTIQ